MNNPKKLYLTIARINILGLYAVTHAVAFNLFALKDSKIVSSENQNENFGYAVALHNNNEGSWILAGAPKHVMKNQTHYRDGGIYVCKNNFSSSNKNFSCKILPVNQEKRKNVLFSCDFEACDLDQIDMDEFNWIRKVGPSPTANTGPKFDHTLQDENRGTYMLLECSQPRSVGEAALMKTSSLPKTSGSCIRFWYLMYGENMGGLNVYIRNKRTGLRMVWSEDSNRGQIWIQGWTSVQSDLPYEIIFEGIVGKKYDSDIGIDDIEVTSGLCEEDAAFTNQALGATIATNSQNGDVLVCAPSWTSPLCKTQYYSTGICYKFDSDLQPNSAETIAPCYPKKCDGGKVDVVFVIDGSGSINPKDFTNIKLWLRSLASFLPFGPDKTQVGVVQYSYKPQKEIGLTDYDNLEDFRNAVKHISYLKGNTSTGRAINYMSEVMFSEELGMRPDAKHVAIVVTDGKSQDDVQLPSYRAKKKGIIIFAIGVGLKVQTELEIIASDPDSEYVKVVNNYKALESIKKQLQESLIKLESQGNTFTTENCQAGLSASFSGDTAVIGTPGLDDWIGGFSLYNSNIPNLSYEPIGLKGLVINMNNVNESIVQYPNIKGSMKLKVKGQNMLYTRISSSKNTVTKNIHPTGKATTFTIKNSIKVQPKTPVGLLNNKRSLLKQSFSGLYSSEKKMKENLMKLLSHAYFGYSQDTGSYTIKNGKEIAIGAPRMQSTGSVFIVKLHEEDLSSIEILKEYTGKQIGSYFGGSVCLVDANNDGFDDLLVGAPLWMGKQLDVGQVTLYLSYTQNGKLKHKKVVLIGPSEAGSRFGLTITSPGDLNLDGFKDFVVGAPSSVDGIGAIYMYNGGMNSNAIANPTQILKASNTPYKLNLFGFSLHGGIDMDGNGYSDLVSGAPGSDKLVVIYTKPVVNINVTIDVSPNLIDISNPFCRLRSQNISNAIYCSDIKICFTPFGLNIPETINLQYTIEVDSKRFGKYKRAVMFKEKKDVTVLLTKNAKSCFLSIMLLKKPLRDISKDIYITVTYDLVVNSTAKNIDSAVLNIYAKNPLISRVKLLRNCSNNICLSDVKLSCDLLNTNTHFKNGFNITVVDDSNLLEIDVNVTNDNEDAYDVELLVTHSDFIYFNQLIFVQNENCLHVTYEEIYSDTIKETEINCIENNCQMSSKSVNSLINKSLKYLKLIVKNPIMIKGAMCSARLQFGFKTSSNFSGGDIYLYINGTNANKDINLNNNVCNISMPIYFYGKFSLYGFTNKDRVEYGNFLPNNVKSISTYKDIGPSFIHNYVVLNNGRSIIPELTLKFLWPSETTSKHDILYLTDFECEPSHLCKCKDVNLFVNAENVNTSQLMYMDVNRGNGDVRLSSTGLNITNMTVQTKYKDEQLSCLGEKTVLCEKISCQVYTLHPTHSINIKATFRLWENTFIEANIWRTYLNSLLEISTLLATFTVFKVTDDSYEITTTAYNRLLQVQKENEVEAVSLKLWVIVLAIIAGIILLGLFILALYKAGFFESKYQKRKEDTIEWQDFDMYKSLQTEQYNNTNSEPMQSHKMSTFQKRSLPETPK